MLLAKLTAFVLLFPGVLCAPPLFKVKKVSGLKKPGSYIVRMKDNASKDAILANLGPAVTAKWSEKVVNGFAGRLNSTALDYIRAHPEVASISEDGAMKSAGLPSKGVRNPIVRHRKITEHNVPWGLERISKCGVMSNNDPWSITYTMRYDSAATGEGVDIYVLDSGINLTHEQFEGRATWGATFGGYPDADGLGHGTHCSGTAGGKTVGVAKKAHLIAVKILSDDDVAWWSDLISGLNYVVEQAAITGRPSVASISIQGDGDDTLDAAITNTVNNGIHVVVCAGNFNRDVSTVSPARAAGAITVAAMDINNNKASFSDYGSGVEVWAPGVIVYSSYIGSNTAYAYYDGTSMSTPHVSGIIAGIISKEGNMSPAAMSSLIQSMALPHVLSGVPTGTVNLLANNGFTF